MISSTDMRSVARDKRTAGEILRSLRLSKLGLAKYNLAVKFSFVWIIKSKISFPLSLSRFTVDRRSGLIVYASFEQVTVFRSHLSTHTLSGI